MTSPASNAPTNTQSRVGFGVTVAAAFCVVIGATIWQQSSANNASAQLNRLTLDEVNALADRLGKPHLTHLPWQDEQGRDLATLRRAEYAADPQAYIDAFAPDVVAAGE